MISDVSQDVHRHDVSHENYQCWLDFAMDRFTLDVDSRAPAILSRVTRNGQAVRKRSSLLAMHLGPGEKTVFSVGVMDQVTRTYTLIVQRRLGISLELLGLRPLTGSLGVPYRPGELQDLFEVNQSLYEDFFEVEYVKADGGQSVECHVDQNRTKTLGEGAPSAGDLAIHPLRYLPSLEQLNSFSATEKYDKERGAVARCRVPVDTWRRLSMVLEITSADGKATRRLRLVVTRMGCPPGRFYYEGKCQQWCPAFHYEQRFNWRCGRCNQRCEFCDHWARCERCQRNQQSLHYRLKDDGSCEAVRVHAYRVYYDLARYLAASCAALLGIYAIVGISWACYRGCCRSSEEVEDELTLDSSQRGPTGARKGRHGGAAAHLLTPRQHRSRSLAAAR